MLARAECTLSVCYLGRQPVYTNCDRRRTNECFYDMR